MCLVVVFISCAFVVVAHLLLAYGGVHFSQVYTFESIMSSFFLIFFSDLPLVPSYDDT